jgi:hypothetical protein
MAISFRCSGCGKEYQVAEEMAGKQAKCRCGATTRVPSQGGEASDKSFYESVAAAMREPVDAPPEPEPPSAPPPEPQAPPRAPILHKAKKRRKTKLDRWRKLVAIASIAYGSIAAVVQLILWLQNFPGTFFGPASDIVLSGAIVAGGVLILKGNRQGPACAGLASIFVCFFPAWNLLWGLARTLSDPHGIELLRELAAFLVVYAVPAGIAVWCLREEMELQRREAEEREYLP